MRFNLLLLLVLLICSTAQVNGQEPENKAIRNGTYRINYKLGSTFELTIKDGRYQRLYDSGELQTGDININEDSFSLYPDEPKIETESNANKQSLDNSQTDETDLIVKNPTSNPLRLPPCNWHELNRPNKKWSKFIVCSSGGIRIQCGKGRIKRLRTE